jgi:ABC-2 type transport system ATP-binding protein
LGKIYESKKRNIVALDSTSFALFQGESLGILGQTGSGKSTLFRILAGLARPTSGEALIHDRPSIDPRARIGVGFVPENPSFPEGQSAFDTLIFSGRLAGLEGDLTGTVVHQLESLELAKWSDTPVSKFSREMTRRLALASALMSGPDLLIIDEPSDRYDKHSRRLFDQSVTTARQSGVTILHLAYSVRLMENTVDRVLFLERGSITGEIPVFDLLASRTLVEFNAEIGEKLIELPADFGHVASITRKRLVVEIDHEDAVNDIIDYLRISGIRIHSVGKREMSPDATVMTSHSVKTEVPT